jgi:hypothetical protein
MQRASFKCEMPRLELESCHWMPPSAKCLRRIAPAAASMVNEFVETTQNTNKTQLVASNYGTFQALVVSQNFITPKLTLYSGHQCNKLCLNMKHHDWS